MPKMNWIKWEWTLENPYPEDLDTWLYVKMYGETDHEAKTFGSLKVIDWQWNPLGGLITHYAIDMERNFGKCS